MFSQETSNSPTTVTLKLSGLASLAGDFHVHVQPIQPASGTPCGSAETGGHYNPLNVAAGQCSFSAPQLCEMGDLSGKSGRRGSLVGLDVADSVWSDSNLPLSEPYSIVGRSVVIHKENGERWVCANIIDPSLPTRLPTPAPVPPTLSPLTPAPVPATLSPATPAPIPATIAPIGCADQDTQCESWKAAGAMASVCRGFAVRGR